MNSFMVKLMNLKISECKTLFRGQLRMNLNSNQIIDLRSNLISQKIFLLKKMNSMILTITNSEIIIIY